MLILLHSEAECYNTLMSRDEIYKTVHNPLNPFVFDEKVVSVFPDMIARSVPGYDSLIRLITPAASMFVKPSTKVYDLGCSLGAATAAVLNSSADFSSAEVIGIDNSDAMIGKCREIFKNTSAGFIKADINDTDINNASLVILNYTLQFISLDKRDAIIQKIADGTNTGGALILSEKVTIPPEADSLLEELHENFKLNNGYSELEISQKRKSLDNILIKESEDVHIARLKKAGYSKVTVWFRAMNFISFLAVK